MRGTERACACRRRPAVPAPSALLDDDGLIALAEPVRDPDGTDGGAGGSAPVLKPIVGFRG